MERFIKGIYVLKIMSKGNFGKSKLTREQISLLQFAIPFGKTICEKHPHIAEHRENKLSLKQICALEFPHLAQTKATWEGLRYGLWGYDGRYAFIDQEPYQGLLSKEKNKSISNAVRSNNMNKINDILKDEKRGAYGMSVEDCAKYGKKGGLLSKENRKGYCGLSKKERSEAGKLSAIKRGATPWDDEAKQIILDNMNNPLYLTKNNRRKLNELAVLVNDYYGKNIRDGPSVGKFIRDENTRQLKKLAPFIYSVIYLNSLK